MSATSTGASGADQRGSRIASAVIVVPTSSGSSCRRTVSTSGSSGIGDERTARQGCSSPGQPVEHAGTDVSQRPVVAASTVSWNAGEQRRVLAGVVGVGGSRVTTVVGGDDEQVFFTGSAQPVRERVIDQLQCPVKARRVLAVAVDLVGLDQVGEHEPTVELADQTPHAVDCLLVGRTVVHAAEADPVE